MVNNHQQPDIKALITLNNSRESPVTNGYRPAHNIHGYLTSGVHYYIDVSELHPNCSAQAMITFVSPEDYPHSLSIGQKLEISEGTKIVGEAIVLEIYNGLLKNNRA